MKNVFKALSFLLVFVLLFTWLDNRFYSYDTAWDATDDWRQEFDIVFMGNSHVYCNINPVIINDALQINSIILASGSQPTEITYYNLKSLLKKSIPKAIVIEANVLNSSVEQLYGTNKEGNLYTNNDGIRNPFERAEIVSHLIPVERWLEAYSSMFRPMETWTRFFKWNSSYKPYRVLGYRIQNGIAESSIDLKSAEQQYHRFSGLHHNKEKYLDLSFMKKTLQLAQDHNIPVYIIKCPISSFNAENSDMMYDLAQLAKNYPVVSLVHDYNLNVSAIGLTQEDFFDGGHLNYLGAAKMTEYLTKDIGQWLGKTPDFSKVGWFKGEHFEELPDGRFRYTVDLYDGCLVRFIAQDGDKKRIASTDFSKCNSIDLPRLGSNCSLSFEIKASSPDSYTYAHPQTLAFILSPSALKNYNSSCIDVVQDGNDLTLINHFNEASVQYAWYVYKGDEAILKQMYTKENSNSFSYHFSENGNYKVIAFVRTMDKSDTKSLHVINVTVDNTGLTWEKL